MPSGIPGAAGLSSLISHTAASVVMNSDEMEAAFRMALLVTLVGSTIPASNILTQVPVLASKPMLALAVFCFSTISLPSNPAFSAIW